ncbi:polycystin-1-like protein 2 [Branchiostoma floridae x Branchiostoma belcheri]
MDICIPQVPVAVTYVPTTSTPEELYDYYTEVLTDYTYHRIDTINVGYEIHVVIRHTNPAVQTLAYLKEGGYPSSDDYNVSAVIPHQVRDESGKFSPEELEELRHSITVPQDMITRNATWYLALQETGKLILYPCCNHPGSDVSIRPMSSNYSLQILFFGCRYWDEPEDKWKGDGCKVSEYSTSQATICLCTHLTSFGAELFTPPNMIDFRTVFSKNIGENPYVLCTIVVLVVIYLGMAILARRADLKDVVKWSVTALSDNRLIDSYHYEVTVYTGLRKGAGTKSNVFFILHGDNGKSRTRRLAGKGKEFSRGSVNQFLMSEMRDLGGLTSLQIWHDNGEQGMDGSWYLNRVQVRDLQTNERSYFICDDWLAVNLGDGQIKRTLPVATEKEMVQFDQLFLSTVKKDFSDGHLWFSVFSRPTRSNFTRVQRVTCCLSLLFCTMVSNAMWYETEKNVKTVHAITIGSLTFTWHQLYVSIMSTLVIFPVNIVLVTLFRKIRPKESTLYDGLDSSKRKNSSAPTLDDHGSVSNIDIESAANNTAEEAPAKKPFLFPPWMVYVAWCVAFLVTFTSAFFSVLYSLEWGPKKSVDWLTSMFLSFSLSLLVVDPIKVLAIAAVLSCVLKKPGDDSIDSNDAKAKTLDQDDEWIYEIPPDDSDNEYEEEKINEPDPEKLARARELLATEAKMSDLLREIARYFLLVLVLMFIAYNNRDPNAYYVMKTFQDTFVNVELSLEQVRTPDDFWTWANNTLIPGIYTGSWYNDKPTTIREQQFLSDKLSFRVGPARLRQLRVPPNSCGVVEAMLGIVEGCNAEYQQNNEEQRTFLPGWKYHPNASYLTEGNYWRYQTAAELGSFSYLGRLYRYSGGGYEAVLGISNLESRRVCDYLQRHGWVDRLTRAILVEFTTYNANSNLFGSAKFLLEFGAMGAAMIGYHDIDILRLFNYVGPFGIMAIVFELVYIGYLAFSIFKETKKLKQQRCSYFRGPWNVLELFIILASLIGITLYIVKAVYTSSTLSALKEEGDKFVSFQGVSRIYSAYSFVLSLVVFLSTLKFMKILRFNKKISMLSATVRHSSAMMVPFAVQFMLVFFAFVHFALIVFGEGSLKYNNIISAAETIFSMTIGKFDHQELTDIHMVLGPVFFITFMLTVFLVIINISFTIINDSFVEVRSDISKQPNDYEIVDFMANRVKKSLKAVAGMVTGDGQENSNDPVYIEYTTECIIDRVDMLYRRASRLYVRDMLDGQAESIVDEYIRSTWRRRLSIDDDFDTPHWDPETVSVSSFQHQPGPTTGKSDEGYVYVDHS